MKNDLEKMQRLLEESTAAGDAPADVLDPEAASLREAWLAFGEMLESAQPPMLLSKISLLPLGEGPGMRPAPSSTRPLWPRLLATGLLAASLLIAVVTVCVRHGLMPQENQENHDRLAKQADSTQRQIAPSNPLLAKSPSMADAPQWDDSLDEQFAQVSRQIVYAGQNQYYRTDAFGLMQYRMEQFRQAIQTDSL
jgi:hypothetical protein